MFTSKNVRLWHKADFHDPGYARYCHEVDTPP